MSSKKINPRVKDILKLIAAGAIVSTAVLAPGVAIPAGLAVRGYDKYKQLQELKSLNRYSLWRVRQILKRLEAQKMVSISGETVKITVKGKRKLLKYDLDTIKLKEVPDGKWRIVIYDVAEFSKKERQAFQGLLKKLKFYPLQKSVYLTPFPCVDEIEYIRQRFHLNSEIKVIVATGLEEAEAYKVYFGI